MTNAQYIIFWIRIFAICVISFSALPLAYYVKFDWSRRIGELWIEHRPHKSEISCKLGVLVNEQDNMGHLSLHDFTFSAFGLYPTGKKIIIFLCRYFLVVGVFYAVGVMLPTHFFNSWHDVTAFFSFLNFPLKKLKKKNARLDVSA